MLIVYEPQTGEILAHCSRIFDSGQWREPSVEEILPRRDPSRLGTLYLKDDPRYLQEGQDGWRIRRDASGAVVGIESVPALALTCDAKDTDGDGVPDVPADGKSSTQITARVPGGAGVEVTFRTTRGSLGKRAVQAAADGTAVVHLRVPTETVLIAVTANAPGHRPATLEIECIPAGD